MRNKSKFQDFADAHRLCADRGLLENLKYSSGRFVIFREQRRKVASKHKSRRRPSEGRALTMGEFIDAVDRWEKETDWDIGQVPCKQCGKPSTRFHTFLKNVTCCDECERL